MKTSKRAQLDFMLTLTVDLLRRSAANPNGYMTRMDIALHYVALRRLGAL